jgi:hypothetical protein
MSFFTWSKTALTNTTADATINWQEGQSPGSVNGSARGMMAALAKYREDMAGMVTLAGTAPTYTITTNQVYTSLADGISIYFRCHSTNTGSSGATLNVDGLGAKALRQFTTVHLVAGKLLTGSIYGATYRLSTDEWLLHNSYVGPLDGLAVTDGNFYVGNGTTIVAESGATARTSLGVGTGDSPEFTAVNIGHASDTTLTRVSAGLAAIEGLTLLTTATGLRTSAMQVFTSSGTYTPATGMKYCLVVGTGGGGGGGGADGANPSSNTGGGGGGGGTVMGVLTAAQIGASKAVTIGAAGAAGVDTGGDGGTGGSTILDGLLTALGGVGGTGSSASSNKGEGGDGGTPTGATLNIVGGDGGTGSGLIIGGGSGDGRGSVGGQGGSSFWGGGAKGPFSATTGTATKAGYAGKSYGAGGSGALCQNTTTGAAGGAGMTGVMMILEFT